MATAQQWPRDAWWGAVYNAEDLTPAERAVARVRYEWAGGGDTTWCTEAEIMRHSGIRSETTVRQTNRSLIAKGWLREIEKARQHRPARYQLTIPRPSDSEGLKDPRPVNPTGLKDPRPSDIDGLKDPRPSDSALPDHQNLTPNLLKRDFLKRKSLLAHVRAHAREATDREVDETTKRLIFDHPDVQRWPSYLRKITSNGDPDLVEAILKEVRAELRSEALSAWSLPTPPDDVINDGKLYRQWAQDQQAAYLRANGVTP